MAIKFRFTIRFGNSEIILFRDDLHGDAGNVSINLFNVLSHLELLMRFD